jgi:hypothetical protein
VPYPVWSTNDTSAALVWTDLIPFAARGKADSSATGQADCVDA